MPTASAKPPSEDRAKPFDATGTELKRGAFVNTLAMIAANFRAIFTILVARWIGPIALGIFSVAWAAVDLISKLGVLGLDDGVTTFVARANAAGDIGRCRACFRSAALIVIAQSTLVATVGYLGFRWFGPRLPFEPEMLHATGVLLFALPGIGLYRISTSVSRGMKVMKHDIYSRGFTESGTTILAFLVVFALGSRLFAPEIAAVVGSTASGLVACALASRLFGRLPNKSETIASSPSRELLAYSLPIGADQLLNAYIWRIDLILLGALVDRTPGLTLITLGIYGAVVGVANGLRKVSQSFIPIFAPVVAGMTSTGDHEKARATYAQLAQWMLWILLPLTAVLGLAGHTILLIFGQTFQNGAAWLTIVAIACATNAFINLGETVIMVQRPRLNLTISIVTASLGTIVTWGLIVKFGVIGAAFGMLATYLVQGLGRNLVLRLVFHWPSSWRSMVAPVLAAVVALFPAAAIRVWKNGTVGEIVAAGLFLAIYGLFWVLFRKRAACQR